MFVLARLCECNAGDETIVSVEECVSASFRPCKRTCLRTCVRSTVGVCINALERIVSVEQSVQVFECSISRLDTHASQYESRHTSLRTSLPLYVKAWLRWVYIQVSCVILRSMLLVLKNVWLLRPETFEYLKERFRQRGRGNAWVSAIKKNAPRYFDL
jgi:hypothetical protein